MKTTPPTKVLGDAAEARALAYLVRRGLVPVERNYRVARGPRARGGEVDLIARHTDGTLVFAARYGLRRFAAPPACRFDVVCVEGERIEWLRAAFDAA